MPPPRGIVLLTAGDIATASQNDTDTAALLGAHPQDPVLTLGDNTYPLGAATEFRGYFAPTWGQHKSRILPCVGNHEYLTPKAAPYYAYFGAAAGDPAKGYYARDLSSRWRLVVCNSEIEVHTGSAQETWLRTDLSTHPGHAYVVAWHRPRFSSGAHGGDARLASLVQACYDHRVAVILNGHDHHYERLAPCDPRGQGDARGPRAFIVGTGGVGLRALTRPPLTITERRFTEWGVLRLQLRAASYAWQFIRARTKAVLDSGTTQLRRTVGEETARAAVGPEPEPEPPPAASALKAARRKVAAPQVVTEYVHEDKRHYVVRRHDGQLVTLLFPSEGPAGQRIESYAATCREQAVALAAELDHDP